MLHDSDNDVLVLLHVQCRDGQTALIAIFVIGHLMHGRVIQMEELYSLEIYLNKK